MALQQHDGIMVVACDFSRYKDDSELTIDSINHQTMTISCANENGEYIKLTDIAEKNILILFEQHVETLKNSQYDFYNLPSYIQLNNKHDPELADCGNDTIYWYYGSIFFPFTYNDDDLVWPEFKEAEYRRVLAKLEEKRKNGTLYDDWESCSESSDGEN